MKNSLEFIPGGRFGENELGEFLAFQPAIAGNQTGAKFFLDFRQCKLPGLNQLMSEFIRIHNSSTELQKETGGGGFAHPHAAGQTAKFHVTVW